MESEPVEAGEMREPIGQVTLRFYAELNDFLPPPRRQVAFAHPLSSRTSVKDLIESLGVPHTEVDLILVNGEPVDFAHIVRDGDRISVYPMFESIDIAPLARLRPRPLREPRFVLDVHLGKLAMYLRMLGFDTLYANDYDDETLTRMATSQRRILLTRDRGLLRRSVISHGYYVRATEPRQQLVEVIRRFDLLGSIAPFQRCMRCNGHLAPVPKQEVVHRLPPRTRRYYDEFYRCQECDQLYWKGSHYRRMQQFIEHLQAGEIASHGRGGALARCL